MADDKVNFGFFEFFFEFFLASGLGILFLFIFLFKFGEMFVYILKFYEICLFTIFLTILLFELIEEP